MEVKRKLQWSILGSAIVLLMVAIPIFILDNGESKYFRYGWHDDFILISVPINNRIRYIYATIFVVLTRAGEVFIGEIANPIIGFNIYNPDKKVITDFTKNELQFYGNTLYIIDSTRYIFKVMVLVTQIDLAFISMLAGEIVSLITIRMLLNEKDFIKVNTNDVLNDIEMQPLVNKYI
uniref:Uncharacterized protein n=1 Tax=viral metagenome TaxID=1070528 RepID=A0A6C0FI65_9ZZZZ|tara:strand:- start:1769 stop:2302 length:534 start_codon:yes stop_codon:yes gene_type:complete